MSFSTTKPSCHRQSVPSDKFAESCFLGIGIPVNQQQLHYTSQSEADIRAPVSGRIWEMITSRGEDVRAGQPLSKVLDCGGAVVTANVTEGVYNQLQLNLTGASGVPANLAINPDVLNREPYRVTVSLPQATGIAKDCNVGRTGRVVFGRNGSEP